jgi:hypothetical protein
MALELPLALPKGSAQYYLLLSFSAVGAAWVLGSLLRLLGWLWRHFLRPAKPLSRYGSWAIITGCTDGIGKAFAFLLAKQRINLVLVGRSKDKLDSLSSEIKSKSKDIKLKTVVLDFTDPNPDPGFSSIKQLVSDLDVGILINSAGLSYPYARFFHEVDDDLAKNLLKMNVEAIVRMVQIVLPRMIERKRGAIVNIGSGASSILPSEPLYALYAATKGYFFPPINSLIIPFLYACLFFPVVYASLISIMWYACLFTMLCTAHAVVCPSPCCSYTSFAMLYVCLLACCWYPHGHAVCMPIFMLVVCMCISLLLSAWKMYASPCH